MIGDKVLPSEYLPDPYNDRQVPEVKAPPIIPLSLQRVFPNNSENADINVDLVKNFLFQGGKIAKECLLEIMHRVRPILSAEANIFRCDGKVVIFGDIRG